jgi:hypothetical protein
MVQALEERDVGERTGNFENSVFTNVGSGRKEKRELSNIFYLYSATLDFIYNSLIFPVFKKFNIGIQLTLGFIINIVALFLILFFIVSQYVSISETTFISLDAGAGVCDEVPLSVTGSYSLDLNGRWLGNSLYNPSSAYYEFTMFNFVEETAAYKILIGQQKVAFSTIGEVGVKQDLAENILYWASWAQVISDANTTSRWQFTGDTRVILDRPNYLGAMGNKISDCPIRSTVAYNAATGKFVLSYSYSLFASKIECYAISNAEVFGYDSTANGDNLSIRWDGTSLILAAAVNKDIVAYSNLLKVESGYSDETFVVNGVRYTKTVNADSRYPKMDPITCFSPDLSSSVPSTSPTQMPTFMTTSRVQMIQTIEGVTVAAANSTLGRAVLQISIANMASVLPAAVFILSIRDSDISLAPTGAPTRWVLTPN